VRVWWIATLLVSCASPNAAPSTPPSAAPNVPTFLGVETEHWLVEQSEPVGRDDILPAFEASARNYGCSTEQLGSESHHDIAGESRSYYGVSAACAEGTIALITLVGGSVRIGCAKPTTHASCDLLRRNIAQSR
jgi:hypothetical protein